MGGEDDPDGKKRSRIEPGAAGSGMRTRNVAVDVVAEFAGEMKEGWFVVVSALNSKGPRSGLLLSRSRTPFVAGMAMEMDGYSGKPEKASMVTL